MEYAIELTIGVTAHQYIDVSGFDSCSLEVRMSEGTTFNSGVISVRKTNTLGGIPVDFTPAKTITAPSLVELDARDWQKARYLVLQVTTSAASAEKVVVYVELKKNDLTTLIDPVEVIDPALGIAAGEVSGAVGVNKFGRTQDADTTLRDIWDLTTQGIWVAPTAARVHQIVSTSADDTNTTGVGARTIQVYGLTSWSTAEVSETVLMKGLTNSATVNSYVIIHRMKVLTKGATSVNVGTITATADTDSTITAQIGIGEGQTQMAIYGVPSVQTAYMTRYYFSMNKAGGSSALADVQIVANPEPDAELTGFLVKHTQSLQGGGNTYLSHEFNPYFKLSGPTIIKGQVLSSVTNADVSGGFDLILQNN